MAAHHASLLVAALALAGAPCARAQLFENPHLVPSSIVTSKALHTGDVHGDGLIDLVVRNANNVVLYPAHVDGSYAESFVIVPTEILEDVAVADWNGDGRDDLAIASAEKPTVDILLSNGDGSFTPAPTLVLPTHASALLGQDLDDDGTADLVTALRSTQRIRIHRGMGDGSFELMYDVEARFRTQAVHAGDFNADGLPDLLAIAQLNLLAPLDLYVISGQGHAIWDRPELVHEAVNDAIVVDLDGDGVDDVVAMDQQTSIVVLAGAAGGPLAPPQFVDVGLAAERLAAGDFDENGTVDLVLGLLFESFLVTLLQSDAEGAGPVFEQAVQADASGTIGLAVFDRDHDDHDDVLSLAATLGVGGRVVVRSGMGDGSFGPQWFVPGLPFDADAADLDGDGRAELVVAHGGSPALQVRPGLPGTAFGPPTSVDAGPAPLRVFARDVTGDDIVDLLTVNSSFVLDQNGVGVAVGAGDGSFALPVFTQTSLLDVEDGIAVDLDGDGLDDVLLIEQHDVADGTGSSLIRMKNVGGGSFIEEAVMPYTGGARGVSAGDLDGDGLVDAVVLSDGGAQGLAVFLATGPSAFAAPVHHALPGIALPSGPVLIDVTGDGVLDAVVGGTTNLTTFPGDGNGAFLPGFGLPGPHEALGFDVADIDGDGDLEILASHVGEEVWGDVSVVEVGGDPLLEVVETHALVGFAPRPIVVDVDGDEAPDVLLPVNSGHVAVLHSLQGPWSNLGHSLAGRNGFSVHVGEGPLTADSEVRLVVLGAAPLSLGTIVIGLSELNSPFKGGVFVPAPDLIFPVILTDAQGDAEIASQWPGAVPTGAQTVLQVWFVDAGGTAGFSATNAITGIAP